MTLLPSQLSLAQAILLVALAAAVPIAVAYVNGVYVVPARVADQIVASNFTADLLDSPGNLPQYGEIQRRARYVGDESSWVRLHRVTRDDGTVLYERIGERPAAHVVSRQADGFATEFDVPTGSVVSAIRAGATPLAMAVTALGWGVLCLLLVGPKSIVPRPFVRVPPKATAEFFYRMQDEGRVAGLVHDSGVGRGRSADAVPVGRMVRSSRDLIASAGPDQDYDAPAPTLDRFSRFLHQVETWMAAEGVGPRNADRHPFDDSTFRTGVILPFKRDVRLNGLGEPSESTTLQGVLADAIAAVEPEGYLSPGQIDWGDLRSAIIDVYSDVPTVAQAVELILGSLAKHANGAPLRFRLDEGDEEDENRTLWSYTLRIEQLGTPRVAKAPRKILRTGSKLRAARRDLNGYADYHIAAPFAEGGPLRLDVMTGATGPLHPDDDPGAFAHVLTFWGLTR